MIDSYWFNTTRPLDVILKQDPSEGLVQHTLETKPYHSKIYEILMTYAYYDDMLVTMIDELEIVVELDEPNHGQDVLYMCGPGYDSGYNFGYGIYWGGGFGSPITKPGWKLENANAEILSASATFGGDPHAGSFLVKKWDSSKYQVLITDLINNQLAFVTYHDMVEYTAADRHFVIAGNVQVEILDAMIIYVPSTNTDSIMFNVTSVEYDPVADVTNIRVLENIPIRTDVEPIGIPIDDNLLPWWHVGAELRYEGADLPSPLDGMKAYFAPIEKYGIFGMALTPSPTNAKDIMRFDRFNRAPINVWIDQPFYAGIRVNVSGSTESLNDMNYTIIKTREEGDAVRIWVIEPIKMDDGHVGIMSHIQIGSPVDEAFCRLVSGPSLTAHAYMKGILEFKLSKEDSDEYDYDATVIIED